MKRSQDIFSVKIVTLLEQKWEKQYGVNAQQLNKNLSHLNHLPIQYKEGYTDFDNFLQFFGKVLYSYATCTLTII